MAKSQDEIKELRKNWLSYTPSSFWEDCIHVTVLEELYPNCLKLLYLLMIFPISAACVERLFSKMKLVKTRLRNQLKQSALESLLRIQRSHHKTVFLTKSMNILLTSYGREIRK